MFGLSKDEGRYKLIANKWLLLSFHICASLFLLHSTDARDFVSSNNTIHDFDSTNSGCSKGNPVPVTVKVQDKYVVMDNGIVQVTLLNPGGSISGIKYNGIDNVLEVNNKEDRRGYWDLVWNREGERTGQFDKIPCTSFAIIKQNEEQVELSFTRKWDHSLKGKVIPLNIDKRYVLLQGSSGFYTYAIYDHWQEWPAFSIGETRVVFKLRKDKFKFMAVSDEIQRYMPSPEDRSIPQRAQPLAYQEAVLIVNPVEPEFQGEVDDKYQYSMESKDQKVHGWISDRPMVGLWQITPSSEFRSGGPIRQELTSHLGPTMLAGFHSSHYLGEDVGIFIGPKEPWKKVYGPIFVYLNSLSDDDDKHGSDPHKLLWEDAKTQTNIEEENWPYDFPNSVDFLKGAQRGVVTGRLQVRERGNASIYPEGAFVGLAAPGEIGSWETESKGYQYWSRTDEDGDFYINNVRAGDYNLYAWVPGFIGDYKYDKNVTIKPGPAIHLDDIVYKPPSDGLTLWEIGIPDRSAAEFFIPDHNPKYPNKLYVGRPKYSFRQYGLWERYGELYPDGDLIYNVGVSDYKKDWFYAQVPRWDAKFKKYVGTTWRINFALNNVNFNGTYKLRLALAFVTYSELQVRVNDPNIANLPLFSSGFFGRDNAIARHGIHGRYYLLLVDVPGNLLVRGSNAIFLSQLRCKSPLQGIMYDYIRLEAPQYIV